MMLKEAQEIPSNPYKEMFDGTYVAGAYMTGYMEAMHQERGKRREEKKRKERKKYFAMQKLTGVTMLIFTAVAVKLFDGDGTIAILTIPLGLSLLLSREMLIVNRYYWKCEEEKSGLPGKE